MPKETFAFGRILYELDLLAFYALKLEQVPDIETVVQAPVAFKCSVIRGALTSGRWPIIGNKPLEDALKEPILFVAGRRGEKGEYYLTPDGSTFIEATEEQIQNHYSLSIWEPEQIEERLLAHFEGRPCQHLEIDRFLGYKSAP